MTQPLAPLYGLVLAGGASRRMGQDKAALALHGRPQLDWACDTLARHCERVFVSIRADQQDDPVRRGRPVIVDVHDGAGPIAGIAAAQAAHPDSAWFVLACDLPFVDDAAISHLISRRDGRLVALVAVDVPTFEMSISAFASIRRKFIIGTGVALLLQPDPAALDNVNTPEDLQRARGHLGGPPNP